MFLVSRNLAIIGMQNDQNNFRLYTKQAFSCTVLSRKQVTTVGRSASQSHTGSQSHPFDSRPADGS